tara:strand:+ start:16141 stop:16803 length:663 start_codon:yes stop_codon:yes gene_type:complete
MGCGPKREDYKPTESQKMNASVALANKTDFNNLYGPLLLDKAEKALDSKDATEIARRVSNADAMQALTKTGAGGQTYDDLSRTNTDVSYDQTMALTGQFNEANRIGKNISNKAASEAIGMRRGQASDAASGLANLSSIQTSKQLAQADANNKTRMARNAMLGELGTAYVVQGISNKMAGDDWHGSGSFGERLGKHFNTNPYPPGSPYDPKRAAAGAWRRS